MTPALYSADISSLRPEAFPARGRTLAHDAALRLLKYAVESEFGVSPPRIEPDANGKPSFPDCPDIHFSYSHTRGRVLCAVSDSPVGADIEAHREVSGAAVRRLMSDCGDFDFFELWTLRESLFKLRGTGSLLTDKFLRRSSEIIAPEPGIFCRVYDCISGCTAAVASGYSDLPVGITEVHAKILFPDMQQI